MADLQKQKEDLQEKIGELQVMVINPVLFIENFFGDLINQLNNMFTKFCIKNNKAKRLNSGQFKSLDEANDWVRLLKTNFEEDKLYYSNRITSIYKKSTELEEKVWNIIERYEKISEYEQVNLKEFEKEAYDCSLEMKKSLFDNDCYIILNKETSNELEKQILENNRSLMTKHEIWIKIFPLIKIKQNYFNQDDFDERFDFHLRIRNLNRETIRLKIIEKSIIREFNDGVFIKDGAAIPIVDVKIIEDFIFKRGSIEHLHENTFVGFDNLQKIDFGNNVKVSYGPNTPPPLGPRCVKPCLFFYLNKIKELHKDTFRGLINLKEINLNDNEIESIDSSIFNDLVKLEKIDLSDNKINCLYLETFIGLDKLKEIDLNGCNRLITHHFSQ